MQKARATMNSSMKRAFTLMTLVTALVTTTIAHAVEITFQVRMAYQIELGNFDPENDFVDLAGTFNGCGTDRLFAQSPAFG